MRRLLATAALATAAAMSPIVAHAQSVDTPIADASSNNVLAGDHITVGVGGVYGPSYEGSDNYTFGALPLLQGEFHGITLTPRAGGLALDLIPDGENPDKKVGFSLGPVATYSRNRAHDIKDPVVLAAGKLKSAIDVGVNAGVTAYQVLDPYDNLTLSADVKWNVNSASKGMTVTPSLSYLTPLSKAMLVTVGVSAKYIDGDYARYYYSVSPLQSTRSGLPIYGAGHGWDNVGASLLLGYDLSGDLRDGGFALFGVANYSHLLGDAKYTPYTSLRGDANQFTVGAGVAYTF
jgi:outer membrane scaffolding protein for murein synthesis (MipA/OmpV family)